MLFLQSGTPSLESKEEESKEGKKRNPKRRSKLMLRKNHKKVNLARKTIGIRKVQSKVQNIQPQEL